MNLNNNYNYQQNQFHNQSLNHFKPQLPIAVPIANQTKYHNNYIQQIPNYVQGQYQPPQPNWNPHINQQPINYSYNHPNATKIQLVNPSNYLPHTQNVNAQYNNFNHTNMHIHQHMHPSMPTNMPPQRPQMHFLPHSTIVTSHPIAQTTIAYPNVKGPLHDSAAACHRAYNDAVANPTQEKYDAYNKLYKETYGSEPK